MEKLSFDSFIAKIKEVDHAISKRGAEYVMIHYEGNNCIGIRKNTNKPFEIDLAKLYQAHVECEVINTSTLKKYVNRKQSPSYAILMKAGLV